MAVSLENLVSDSQLEWPDYLVIVLYFVIVIAVGIWSSCQHRGSIGGYFLAGRSMNFVLVGCSLFASNIGSGHFIGQAGTGAASGIGVAGFELNALYVLLLLGWVFVPVYMTSGIQTMPEYMKKRFGGQRIRIYLSVLALILYVFTKISADLYAGAVFIKQSLGWDIWGSIIALLVLAAIFTVAGGLTAVIWTDFIQTIIMIIGAFVLMIISFVKVGGYERAMELFLSDATQPNLTRRFLSYENQSMASEDEQRYGLCGVVPRNSLHLLRSADDGELPWTGMTFGLTISAVWYWCSDQVIVQRTLAAKNLSHAKASTILAGYMKILPLFIIVLPGMISRILYPDLVGCADPVSCKEICDNPAGCTNIAYALLVVKLMPVGARGLLLSVMMSALMSSLTSIFNSSSTIFTLDIWKRIRRGATETELLIVGRVFVIALVAVGIIWIPIIQQVSELFHYIQAVTSFLAPPVCAVYVLAISWKRINEQGAFYGLMVGLVTGMIRFIWEYSYGPAPPCGHSDEDNRPDVITKVHYLHFGILLYVIVTIVTIVISLLTQPIDDKYLRRLTFLSRFEEGERIDLPDGENPPQDQQQGVEEDGGDSPRGEGVPLAVINGDVEGNAGELQPAAGGHDQEQAQSNYPWYRRAFNWICGVESVTKASIEEQRQVEEKQTNIEEPPRWRMINNANAILMLTVASFVWGYWA